MFFLGYCRNMHTNLCPCFVCCKKFSLDNGVEDLLTHICFTHHIVIENIDCIADFKKYMEYYLKRYKNAPLESFTKSITIEVPEKNGKTREQKYYLLGDLPEDETLRKTLHAKRLKAAEKQQKRDLSSEYYSRHCFYCHQTLEVTNAQFVNHLRGHGFQLGHPDKLVYIGRFIEAIEDTFRNLHCLYCDMEFESCRALVNHMKEKAHLKIHPNNRFYDQFYMINYVEFGKTWLDFLKEKGQAEGDQECRQADEDTDWSSWGTEPEYIMCLFCKHVCRSWDGTLLHMLVSHNFDFRAGVSHLRFYQQVKVVNYIRRRILNGECINCEFVSLDQNELVCHMERNDHLMIPALEKWNQAEYLFCSMENDMFLYHLEDQEDENDNEEYLTEMKETSDLLPQIDIENMGSESGRSSFSQETNSEHQNNTISSIDELDEGDSDRCLDEMKNWNEKIIIQSEVSSSVSSVFITESERKVENHLNDESHSEPHRGGGDSIQKCPVPEEILSIKRVNEFGDA